MTKESPHGMSSRIAQIVKNGGTRKETLYIKFVGGTNVGTKQKSDVVDKNGKHHTIKGGKEWQIFLFRPSHFEDYKMFIGRDIFWRILNCFPKKWMDYSDNAEIVKNNIVTYIDELYFYLCDYDYRYKFLDQAFFDERIDYLALYYNDVYRVYSRSDTLWTLMNALDVKINSSHQKVTFTYNGKLILEIEYRTTDDGKYPSMVLKTGRDDFCRIFRDAGFRFGEISPNYYVYGNAIESINLGDFICIHESEGSSIDSNNNLIDYLQSIHNVYLKYISRFKRFVFIETDAAIAKREKGRIAHDKNMEKKTEKKRLKLEKKAEEKRLKLEKKAEEKRLKLEVIYD
jgi:hypothetical protein